YPSMAPAGCQRPVRRAAICRGDGVARVPPGRGSSVEDGVVHLAAERDHRFAGTHQPDEALVEHLPGEGGPDLGERIAPDVEDARDQAAELDLAPQLDDRIEEAATRGRHRFEDPDLRWGLDLHWRVEAAEMAEAADDAFLVERDVFRPGEAEPADLAADGRDADLVEGGRERA